MHLHTGAVDASKSFVDFSLGELDETSGEEVGKYPKDLRVTLAYRVSDGERPHTDPANPPAYLTYNPASASSKLLVSEKQEKGHFHFVYHLFACSSLVLFSDLIYQQLGIKESETSPEKPKRPPAPQIQHGNYIIVVPDCQL